MAGEDKKTPAPGDVDADSVVRQLGQAGRFHMRVYVLMALAAVQVGLLHTTYIFLAAGVPYRYCLLHSHSLLSLSLKLPVSCSIDSFFKPTSYLLDKE
ncbi:hypothetical protein HW555_005359 [Spodoptera exigua]|uniref:Uncharacterized protein n=1 Tax=Spodoptera exigua TaxID=7107 RepID=A0A835L4K3_SPOEX|nr:hypothetical protein HW555_005359 [Spodoptera exigua]